MSQDNPLRQLEAAGQSVWLDFLSRRFVQQGELAGLIERDGISGVTSNPAIFEKAIAHGAEYEDALRARVRAGESDPARLYEQLAVEDIRNAADVLRPVHERTDGNDGFVSFEVSPRLAHDTRGSIEEARRLWSAVDRPNLMIKVPATPEGLPAIRALLDEGINVNITLLFSRQVYEQVANAYIDALSARVARGDDVRRLRSVASFFVSRIDTAVDGLIEARIAEEPGARDTLGPLLGNVAIANAKLAYQRFGELFSGPRWESLSRRGACRQRLLWGSTGTKNTAYSDVMYVEALVGPDTVNTVPPATLDAFRDHGVVRPTLEENVDDAERVLRTLDASGIALDAVTQKLQDEGVRLFAEAFDKLLDAVAAKRRQLRG